MKKQEQYFAKIAEFKERFRKLLTASLRSRLTECRGFLYKEAAIALRVLLEERDQQSGEQTNGN